jgi:hypothetical protein
MTTLLVVLLLLLIAPFMMMGAVVAAASPAVEATNDLDEVSELEIEDGVYSDGDEIIPSSPPSPASFGTSSSPPPLGSSSSRPFVEPPIEHRGRLPNATGQGDDAGLDTGIGLNNTGPTTSTNITETTSTASFTAQPTTQTNGLLTATINGTHFTTNQTIAVNGTVGEAAGPFIAVYAELKDPHNDTLAFESAPIVRSNKSGADNETSFSYSLVAGHDDSDAANSDSDSGSHNKRFWKPMNETGNNYTMIVGYATPAPSSPGSVAAVGGGEYSRSEVQFVFAYEHLLPPEGEEGAAVATTTPAEEPGPEPVVEPEEPEEEVSEEDGEDCDNSYPDECIPPPPPILDCSDIDEDDFEVQGSDPHGFDDDNDGVGCEAEDSSSSSDDDSNDDNSDDEIDGNSISNFLTNKLDDIFGDDNDNNSNRP